MNDQVRQRSLSSPTTLIRPKIREYGHLRPQPHKNIIPDTQHKTTNYKY